MVIVTYYDGSTTISKNADQALAFLAGHTLRLGDYAPAKDLTFLQHIYRILQSRWDKLPPFTIDGLVCGPEYQEVCYRILLWVSQNCGSISSLEQNSTDKFLNGETRNDVPSMQKPDRHV